MIKEFICTFVNHEWFEKYFISVIFTQEKNCNLFNSYMESK